MFQPAWVLGILLLWQVPPPGAADAQAAGLRRERDSIRAHENEALQALADRLAKQGQKDQAGQVRAGIEADLDKNGASRFVPLPEVVPPVPKGLANLPATKSAAALPRAEIQAIQAETVKALFDLASKAAAPETKRYALAEQCLRALLQRDPNHAEARRLLGFVPHEGGWATPFAVKMLTQGKVKHPVVGWVTADWIPHLDRGELPAPIQARGSKERRWLPAAEADALHHDWSKAWEIDTEHFHIQTNVPLSEAIAFARLLEDFRELFFALMADVIGDDLPLAQRFRNPKLTPKTTQKSHWVAYFSTKDEFVSHLSPILGEGIQESLGVYLTPKEAKPRGLQPMSYFFRDPNGQLQETETLYHEVSHQLLFESAARGNMDQNVGNFWVFEGLGTYFETVAPQADGSIQFGGLIGPRIGVARWRLVERKEYIPLEKLVALSREVFSLQGDVPLRYAEAMALTVFFMQAEGGRYRDSFLEYVKKAYRGQLRRGTAQTLTAILGVPYTELDRTFLQFLKAGTPAPKEAGGP